MLDGYTIEQEREIEQRLTKRHQRVHQALIDFHAWTEAPENHEHMENVRDGDPLANARYQGFADEFQRKAMA